MGYLLKYNLTYTWNCRASLWYVAASVEEPHNIVPVPPITYANPEDEIKGQRRYYTQKNLREEQKSKKGVSLVA